MPHAKFSKSFEDSGRNAILILAMDTINEYGMDYGGAVVWPSATNNYFLLNFTSILMSNIILTSMYSYPGIIFPFLI